MRKIRHHSKSGFTLLEVILAVVILAIASTMIMKGFIAVMVYGKNNNLYAKSGAENYRAALNLTIAKYANNPSQADTMSDLGGNGNAHVLTAAFDPSYTATGVNIDDMAMVVDLQSYSGGAMINLENVYTGTYDDGNTSTFNRFAFFYDFADYIGASNLTGDHIIRWGFVFNPAGRNVYDDAYYNQAVYVDKNNNGLVGPDDTANQAAEFVGWAHYGWYCFNAAHDPATNTCRSTPVTPTH